MELLSSYKKFVYSALLVSVLGLMSCGNNADTTTETNESAAEDSVMNNNNAAVATLSGTNADTTVSGTVRFDKGDGQNVKMSLQISVPKKAGSSVAVHIHEHADCGEMGQHAGGHWNPTDAQHGKWGGASFHSGDIGNIDLDASGNGSVEVSSDLWSIGGDAKTDVLNKTIIVHSGVDDYTSQPSGNSGSRIGCGVIQASGN